MASTPSSYPQHNQLGYAFHEIALEKTASSSTAVTRLLSPSWDVFINHCGIDVKYTIATTIYDTLTRAGLRVFLDKEALQGGDVIPTKIQDAMSSASLHIAIVSTNYARSPWCLAELSFMLKTRTRIIPLFFRVDPSDLRWVEKGIYADAFIQHEMKGRYTSQKLQEWKMALQTVSFLSGCVINNNHEEGRVLKNIVTMVFKTMEKVPIEVAKHPVGVDDVVQDFEGSILESAQNVQIVGIVGMGGAGKTTLAIDLYNKKCSSFLNSSFIFDVRDADSKNLLHEKQKKLLEDLGMQKEDLKFDNIKEGKGIVASRLRFISVLIVLDDVDHEDQLDALLPTRDRLGSGSLIIITSRELGVLTKWGISSTSIYRMKALNRFYAKQLFCWHAFLQSHPLQGFEDLVEKFLNVCNGLPLSLKVFGGQVYGKSKGYWEAQLHNISKILPENIKERLKVSYDALDKDEQEVFIDIACFMIRERIDFAIAIWDGFELNGGDSWETLVNKCLVDLDQNNCITMHDHLRDLGRDLAHTHSPSRLWHQEHITNIQKQAGCMGIRCFGHRRLPSWLEPTFQLIHGEYEFIKNSGTPAEEPVWLCWHDLKNRRKLPSRLSLQKLRILVIENAPNLKNLWAETNPPVQLRELIIRDSRKLQSFPTSIGRLKHLRFIIAKRVDSLPKEFCGLESLEHLELSYMNMSSLPTSFGDLTNLRHIDFSSCSELEMLPVSFKQLIHLQHLNLGWCGNLKFRSDMMENMTKLEYLKFSGCSKLEELPHHITNQASLRELYACGTRLKDIPINIGVLGKLEVLEIGSPVLEILPSSLENLSSLSRLKIDGCKLLKSLPEDFGQLSHLQHLCISNCPLRQLGSTSSLCKLKTIDIGYTDVSSISIYEDSCPSLKMLSLEHNDRLTDIEALPTSVEIILLSDCPRLKKLPSFATLSSIQEIEIKGCHILDKIEGLEHSRSLETLTVMTLGKSGGIQSLEQAERLKSVTMVAERRSALQPCIQSIKKWPREMVIIGGKAVSGVESVMDSFVFPNLTVVRLLKKIRFYKWKVESGKTHSSDAAIVCFLVTSSQCCWLYDAHVPFYFWFYNNPFDVSSEGEWVIVGVFRQGCSLMDKPTVAVEAYAGTGEVKRGMIVVGEEGRILEAFTHFWDLILL